MTLEFITESDGEFKTEETTGVTGGVATRFPLEKLREFTMNRVLCLMNFGTFLCIAPGH